MSRKYELIMLLCSVLICGIVWFSNLESTQAAKKNPTSGKDEYGNTWTYDTMTKTMTFSGAGVVGADFVLDGHTPEPEWHCWADEAKRLIIEGSFTKIGRGLFREFAKLESIQWPDTIENIGGSAFSSCMSLKEVVIPEAVTVIDDFAFSGNYDLERVVFPVGLKKIGNFAFSGSEQLREVVLPDTVTTVGESAFTNCTRLEKVTLSKKLKTIKEFTFWGCKRLSQLEIPESVTKIGVAAFQGTGLKKMVIPKSVTSIYRKEGEDKYKSRDGLFKGCKNLRSVTIRSKKLKKVYKYAFMKLNKKVVFYVPKSKVKKYRKMFLASGSDKKIKVRAI